MGLFGVGGNGPDPGWDPDGDDDGDGIPNVDEDIVVTADQIPLTVLGDGRVGRLGADGLVRVYRIDPSSPLILSGLPLQELGLHRYTITVSRGELTIGFPLLFTYTVPTTQYELTPVPEPETP
jgi:hypothetical protein